MRRCACDRRSWTSRYRAAADTRPSDCLGTPRLDLRHDSCRIGTQTWPRTDVSRCASQFSTTIVAGLRRAQRRLDDAASRGFIVGTHFRRSTTTSSRAWCSFGEPARRRSRRPCVDATARALRAQLAERISAAPPLRFTIPGEDHERGSSRSRAGDRGLDHLRNLSSTRARSGCSGQ